jgi:glycine cleavage system H protein
MSNVPTNIKYLKTHEWVRVESDGSLTVGISDHAQHALGDLVFVEVPEVGKSCKAGDACAVVESVKAASDIYSPVTGEVTAGNADLSATPELINQDPYGKGWIYKIKPSNAGELNSLLDAKAYEQVLKEEG